jgi:hypothetical protein
VSSSVAVVVDGNLPLFGPSPGAEHQTFGPVEIDVVRCTVELTAPAVVDIAPGHDAWVEGDEPAVLIEVDYEADTVARLGVAAEHHH